MTTRRVPSRRPLGSLAKARTFGQKIAGAVGAIILVLVVAAAFQYAITRPFAHTIESTKWSVRSDEEVVASPIAAGSLLSIEGVNHEGVDVYFDKARLDLATQQSLAALQLDSPNVEQAITWRSMSPDVTGHTTIDVDVGSVQPDTEIHLASHDERSNAVLSLIARHATLRVRLTVVPGEADMSATAEAKRLEWANKAHVSLPGAFPVLMDVPEGARVRFVFPNNQPRSILTLGAGDNGTTKLAVRDIGVRPLDTGDYRIYACGAEQARISWRLAEPSRGMCSPGHLFAKELRLAPDSLDVLVVGSAWVAKDGRFDRSEWYSWLDQNPVISKIGEVLISAFVAWVGYKLTGVRPGKKR